MTTTCVVTHPVISPQERLPLVLHASDMTFNPAGSLVDLWIGLGTYQMQWIGAATLTGSSTWDQYAETSVMFVGSAVAPVIPPDVALTPGRHYGTPVITLQDGRVVTIDPIPIDVR